MIEHLLALIVASGLQGFEPNITDGACGAAEIRLAPAPGVEITGHCEDIDLGRLLHISVAPLDSQQIHGRLHRVSLGFCGEIVSAEAAPGWTVTVRRSRAQFGQPAQVEWNLVAGPLSSDQPNNESRLDGFSVVLKPGWRRAIAFGIGWRESAAGSSASHDCGEWPK